MRHLGLMLTEIYVIFFRHCDRNINANIVPVDMTVSLIKKPFFLMCTNMHVEQSLEVNLLNFIFFRCVAPSINNLVLLLSVIIHMPI